MLPFSATSVTSWPSSSLIGLASSRTSPCFKLTPRASTTTSSAAIAAEAVPNISAAKASAGSPPVARMAYSDTLLLLLAVFTPRRPPSPNMVKAAQ